MVFWTVMQLSRLLRYRALPLPSNVLESWDQLLARPRLTLHMQLTQHLVSGSSSQCRSQHLSQKVLWHQSSCRRRSPQWNQPRPAASTSLSRSRCFRGPSAGHSPQLRIYRRCRARQLPFRRRARRLHPLDLRSSKWAILSLLENLCPPPSPFGRAQALKKW